MSDGSNNNSRNSNNNGKDLEAGYGSKESFRKRESPRPSKKTSIRVSSFPLKLQQDIAKMNLDVDQKGELGEQEITLAIDNLVTTSKYNKHLKMLVCFLVVFSMLLIACVFGATIAAARLSQETTIDPVNGIMYAKGTHETMKTEEVKVYGDDANIATMTNGELDALKDIVLGDGDVKFRINGYARAAAPDDVVGGGGGVKLLVDGGTITYGPDGHIVDSTGNAQELLRYAYPPDDDVDDDRRRSRNLATTCGDSSTTTTVSSTFNKRTF